MKWSTLSGIRLLSLCGALGTLVACQQPQQELTFKGEIPVEGALQVVK